MTSILDENLQVISVSELNLNARNILESKFHKYGYFWRDFQF